VTMWTTAKGSSHPLARLEGKVLGGATMEIELGPKNRVGAHYFRISLRDRFGNTSQPLLLALHHSGPYPSYNWIEVIRLVKNIIHLKRETILSDAEIERLFQYLADLIPSGGHIMVEYESSEWAETRLAIGCGIPPIATHLGSMLFRVGCGVSFKDWYFAEGGSEGPRKLQGYKALSEDHRRARAADMAAEIRSFLLMKTPPNCGQPWEAAQERAVKILNILSTDDTSLAPARGKT
jgi:hypothetical protein